MNYLIGNFSKLTGISIYALRYYEDEKLITPKRDNNGRRIYSNDDVRWIEFIKRLKDTDMPIKEIQRYACLRAEGDSTLEERMKLLEEHKINLENKIREENNHLTKLNEKIKYYKKLIDKNGERK